MVWWPSWPTWTDSWHGPLSETSCLFAHGVRTGERMLVLGLISITPWVLEALRFPLRGTLVIVTSDCRALTGICRGIVINLMIPEEVGLLPIIPISDQLVVRYTSCWEYRGHLSQGVDIALN